MAATFSLILIIIACVAACWTNRAPRKAPAAHDMPMSYKHIRTHYVCEGYPCKVTYYNHAGRKVTTREYPSNRYHAVIASARAKGYRVR